ncbi:MAG TPA: helix-turn-helix transcriptional regulator [Vicinamibacterales bacterium]|nr:helix-turn-helix transcriptional regulator [Vicinamibacterales bacterium]
MASGPLGEFEVLVLMAVLHLGDEAYPPAVRAAIESRTGRPVSRGAVYVTLNRLEAKRLLGSRLDDSSDGAAGRQRRFYRLSSRGLQALRRALSAVDHMRVGIETLLEDL